MLSRGAMTAVVLAVTVTLAAGRWPRTTTSRRDLR